MKRVLIALVGATAFCGLAQAQSNYPSVGGATVPAAVQECLNSSGVAVPVSSGTCANPAQVTGTITQAPAAGAVTSTAVTVTNASTTLITSAATKFLSVKNESTTASIAIHWSGGTAALNTAGSETLPPGASRTWDGTLVPTGVITGISSAATSPATFLTN